MKYRRDIDGLRSLAVLSVVAYHYFPPVLPGGFIGVDIFFVISGYLISKIIFSEINNKNFSIIRFYMRRVNRIFPALGVVLLSSLALGWITLFPDEYKALGNNVAASTIFVENIFLWMQSGYFDSDSVKKPLLHIWSLGVEEQFYILYPPLLVIASRLGILNNRFLITCCLVSFILSMYVLHVSQTADFYLPLTRYWELAIGGIVAWRDRAASESPTALPATCGKHPGLMAGAGLLAILLGFALVDARTPFPGAAALLPALGAALIIAAGPQSLPNRLVFSNRAAVFVGKISYPLYLWHWPLLSFLFIVNIEKPEPPIRLVLLALSFVLATATWFLIETPLRKRHNNERTTIALVALMAMIAAAGWTIAENDGIEGRLVNRVNGGATVHASGIDNPPIPIHNCTVPPAIANLFRNCIEEKGEAVRFVLLGDSKADALYHGLMRTSLPGGRWLYLGGADATTFGAPLPLISHNPAYAHVQTQSQAAIDYINSRTDLKLVLYALSMRNIYQLDDNRGAGRIFASYDPHYLARLQNNPLIGAGQDAVMRAVGELVAGGKTVALLVDNPPLPPLRTCNGRITASVALNEAMDLHRGSVSENCLYPVENYRNDSANYLAMLNNVKSKYGDNVVIVDMTNVYCNESGNRYCGTSLNENAIYGYTDHISSYTAGIVGKLINEQLKPWGAH